MNQYYQVAQNVHQVAETPAAIVVSDQSQVAQQLANLEEIRRLIEQGAQFFVGHSGGKDSQAMFAALRKIVPAEQLHVVHADLGTVEHVEVKSHIKNNIGSHELLIAEAIHADGSRKDFFSAVRARRASLDAKGRDDAPAFPSSAARFCTSDLKTGPIWKVIRQHGAHQIVVNCVGIRGEESPARAKKIAQRGTLKLNSKNTNSRRQAYDWWPIANWLIDEVWQEIEDAGQTRHPVYETGNDRLSCVFCIFGSRGDLRNGQAAHPELFRRYEELEREVRGTMFNGETLAQRINSIKSKENDMTNTTPSNVLTPEEESTLAELVCRLSLSGTIEAYKMALPPALRDDVAEEIATVAAVNAVPMIQKLARAYIFTQSDEPIRLTQAQIDSADEGGLVDHGDRLRRTT